jgi:hypothetical protein
MPNGISVFISFGLTRLDENPILEELYVLSTLAADGPGSTPAANYLSLCRRPADPRVLDDPIRASF